ncbi:MAG: hypothetical protein ACREOF_20985 [Gemmatimonadales bacterium]
MPIESTFRAKELVGPDGRPLGRIIEPRADALVGRASGTVLLVRDARAIRPAQRPTGSS